MSRETGLSWTYLDWCRWGQCIFRRLKSWRFSCVFSNLKGWFWGCNRENKMWVGINNRSNWFSFDFWLCFCRIKVVEQHPRQCDWWSFSGQNWNLKQFFYLFSSILLCWKKVYQFKQLILDQVLVLNDIWAVKWRVLKLWYFPHAFLIHSLCLCMCRPCLWCRCS